MPRRCASRQGVHALGQRANRRAAVQIGPAVNAVRQQQKVPADVSIRLRSRNWVVDAAHHLGKPRHRSPAVCGPRPATRRSLRCAHPGKSVTGIGQRVHRSNSPIPRTHTPPFTHTRSTRAVLTSHVSQGPTPSTAKKSAGVPIVGHMRDYPLGRAAAVHSSDGGLVHFALTRHDSGHTNGASAPSSSTMSTSISMPAPPNSQMFGANTDVTSAAVPTRPHAAAGSANRSDTWNRRWKA